MLKDCSDESIWLDRHAAVCGFVLRSLWQSVIVQPYPLRVLKNLNRGREIATVLFNYGFGDVLERLGIAPYLHWGRRLIFWRRHEPAEVLTTPRRIRLALQDLGPTFIKFGQVLSTRPDLIPNDVIKELEILQEHVPTFPTEEMRSVLEAEFGRPINELFAEFDEEPMAAGSLAQVHAATSHAGEKLVVKVRRPHVVQLVERDLDLMFELAGLLERHVPESRVFDPIGLVKYFARTIRRELNFSREARAMQDFQRLFADDARVHIPYVDSNFVSESVIVMERVDGLAVSNIAGIRAWNLDPAQIAVNGASIFLRQAFEMGRFHGDPHPGNLRVGHNGELILLDFGMVGYLDSQRREQLVDLFVAIARHDVDSAIRVLLTLGHANTPQIDLVLLQVDVRDFLDSYYNIPLEQINVGRMLNDFVGILATHGLQCPGELMLLIRACITLEGIGRQLDPQFNMAQILSPFIENLIKERYTTKRVVERTVADIQALFNSLHDLPVHLGRTLKKVSQDDFKVKLEHRGLDHLINEFDRSSNRLVVGVLTASMIVSTALIIRTTTLSSIWFAVPLFVLSGLLGIWLIWGILRSGRL